MAQNTAGLGQKPGVAEMLRVVLTRRMLVALVMGFSAGLPLLLTLSTLQAWMKDEGVDLTKIGLVSLFGLPYTLKFLWSPLMDRFRPPWLGRRRGWLLGVQILLAANIMWIGTYNPAKNLYAIAVMAFLITFFSASQDIVIDAYRREDLADEELGLGSTLYVSGYRLAMLASGAGALALADNISWSSVYLIMGALMVVGILTTLLTPEPVLEEVPPQSMKEAVIEPFVEYFRRDGALLVLAFILFYKVGDGMANHMTIPFFLDLGFTKTQVAAIAKSFGFVATIAGGFLGGFLMLRLGINRSLWVFGLLQMVSTLGFSVLAVAGPSKAVLAGVIAFENLASGMGTTAFLAFMASLTNKKFTATQYALLSSLMGVPRVIASAPTGYMVKALGWEYFFITCTLIALPGLWLLARFAPWSETGQPIFVETKEAESTEEAEETEEAESSGGSAPDG